MVTTAEKPQRQHAWVRIAFPASVILNIFLVALVVGHILHRAGYGRDDSSIPPMARALANAEASLSPSDASAFGSIIRSNKPGYIQRHWNSRKHATGLGNRSPRSHLIPLQSTKRSWFGGKAGTISWMNLTIRSWKRLEKYRLMGGGD